MSIKALQRELSLNFVKVSDNSLCRLKCHLNLCVSMATEALKTEFLFKFVEVSDNRDSPD